MHSYFFPTFLILVWIFPTIAFLPLVYEAKRHILRHYSTSTRALMSHLLTVPVLYIQPKESSSLSVGTSTRKHSKKRFGWDTMLKRLKEFKDTHGHVNVTKEDEDHELFQWTMNLRYNYRHQAINNLNQTSSLSLSSSPTPRRTATETTRRRHELSPQKFKALQELGFDWNAKRKFLKWSEMLPRLKEFHREHGHTRVTIEHGDLELYHWTQNLIRNYGHQLRGNDTAHDINNNKNNFLRRLPEQKVAILRDMEFSWDTRSSQWERCYQDLKSFWKENGHCRVPFRENTALCIFVRNQKREYKRYLAGNYTSMTKERIQALQRIQFEWSVSHELAWKQRKNDLIDYEKLVGHVHVPQNYHHNLELGRWCMNQRTKYRYKVSGKRTGLTQDRIRELEKIDFQWSWRQARWNRMVDRLKRYQEEHGHFEIATSDYRNSDLRQWLNEQRHFYRNNRTSRLTENRIAALESIPGFSWRKRRSSGPSKDDWSKLFEAIREKGITPGGRAKTHMFDGVNPFAMEVKTVWTEQELLALWNEADDDDDVDDDYYEDEASRLFVQT